jgi:ribose 5-phosphate isomerase B
MKIAIGSDHAGFELKEQLRETLRAAGYEVADLGTASTESTDYPDYAAAVARAVRDGQADKGILVCSSGVGMSIAANKIKGIRAALGTNPEEVSFVRRHNDANVLAIGAKYTGAALAGELVNLFLTTEFEGGRHQRRLDKIKVLEQTE